MLEQVVRYLRAHGVAFRLSSQPAPEPLPPIASPLGRTPRLVVDTSAFAADDRPILAVYPRGNQPSVERIRSDLGARLVREARGADWPGTLPDAPQPWPPLGGLFRATVLVDDRVAAAAMIVFAAFAPDDYIEIAYNDFARIEQPRVLPLAERGELPPAEESLPSGGP